MNIDINLNETATNETLPDNLIGENSQLDLELTLPDEEEQTIDLAKDEEVEAKTIAVIPSAYFRGLLKIIEIVSNNLSSNEILNINEGIIKTTYNSGYFYSDLTGLFNKNSWIFKDPKSAIKKLKLIAGNEQVVILESATKYILYSTIGDVKQQKITIQKLHDSIDTVPVEFDLGKNAPVSTLVVDPGVVSVITNAFKSIETIAYNVYLDEKTNEIVKIGIADEFEEYLLTSAGRTLVKYKTAELFPVTNAHETTIKIYDDEGIKKISVAFLNGINTIEFKTTLKPVTMDNARTDFSGI